LKNVFTFLEKLFPAKNKVFKNENFFEKVFRKNNFFSKKFKKYQKTFYYHT